VSGDNGRPYWYYEETLFKLERTMIGKISSISSVLTVALFAASVLIAGRRAQAQSETVLYSFCSAGTSCPDGEDASSSLIADGAGNFYGTTQSGGIGVGYGQGTVFEISPDGDGGWTETVLYAFTGGTDGGRPVSPVMLDNFGNLYGTTQNGGTDNYGVVFKLTPTGNTWAETVLHSFAGGLDGENPTAGLIMDSQGNLYGTSDLCAFELSLSGVTWTLQVIYELGGGTHAALTMDPAGNLFGVNSFSEVFEISPNGSGGWNPATIIHTFTGAPGDGYYPEGTLVLDKAGNLYGTTTNGGTNNSGTVYELTPGSGGVWSEKILYSFGGANSNGEEPWAGVVLAAAGKIYGTTPFSFQEGTAGTVFGLMPQVGTGTYKEKILWTFDFTNGADPIGGVILDNSGNLYGTTSSYGAQNGGNVYRINMHVVPTTTALTSSLNPSIYGQPVTLTATVTSKLGPPPDGETVTFMQGPVTLGTGTLSAGSAIFTTSTLRTGSVQIAAVYYGDAQFNISKSKPLTQQVSRATTTTTLVSSLNPSSYGEPVTFTATVVSQFGSTVAGSVAFYDGNTLLGHAVGVSGGTASYTTSTLSVRTQTIGAKFEAGPGFTGSSASLRQTVN
jgi:uncharacterized repeat protein (TIGR03803 family)